MYMAGTSNDIRVLLVDDHATVLQTLRSALRPLSFHAGADCEGVFHRKVCVYHLRNENWAIRFIR